VTEAEAARHGEVLAGRYQLMDTIAVGGSGAVYRAAVDSGGHVAVKVMHAEHPEGDAERRRFGREAQIIQALVHPHVVRVLDYGHTRDGMPFLVFPLLDGNTLDSKLKIAGALPAAEVGRISLQVLSALERAHDEGIAHRDIKPANIFLVPSVLGDNVQILDFGLAKLVFQGDGAEVTRHGALVGTPRYMAPEQVRGEQVSETADIYSFGLVMAEMLLGHPVVTASRELDIYMTHGSDKPLELAEVVLASPFAAITPM
jgi:serine/threonine-protein kinase